MEYFLLTFILSHLKLFHLSTNSRVLGMAPKSYHVNVRQHAGSSAQDIENEPDCGAGNQNRIGFLDWQDRRPGVTPAGGAPLLQSQLWLLVTLITLQMR